MTSKIVQQEQAETLFLLCKHHKETCRDEHCEIILWLMLDIYKELIGRRKLTEEESMVFC
jgi:hypothetical protein